MMIIKEKYYHPNNTILVICGDVKHEAAFKMARDIFGDWKHSGFDPHQKYPIPEFKSLTKSEYFVKQSSIAATPYMIYQWEGPDYRNDSAATIAADVFNTLLGLNSSKWQQALIDKGLATYAGMQYQTLKYVGPVLAFVVPNPDKLKECHEEIMKQVAAFSTPGYFTNEQLEDAKGILLRSKVRETEKPSTLPMQLTYQWCSTSLDYFTDLTNNYQKVTEADIRRFIEKYITNKPFIAGIIINEEMNKKYNPGTYFTQK
jgi:zinc protease